MVEDETGDGYQVYAINPLQSARARQGNGVSGAKSDAGDAHVLADLVRTHCHQLRAVAGDSKQAGAVKVWCSRWLPACSRARAATGASSHLAFI